MSKKSNKNVESGTIQKIESSVLENQIALTLTMRKWGNHKKATAKQLTESDKGESTGTLALKETTRITVGKKLLVSKEYNNIVNIQQKLTQQIEALTVPSFIKRSFYFAPSDKVAEIVKLIEDTKALQAEAVKAFLKVYSKQIEEAKTAFEGGTLFRESDYLTEDAMRERFSIGYNLFQFEVAKNLPKEIAEAEAKKLQEGFKKAEGMIAQTLLEGFEGVLTEIQKRLAPDKDGKAQGFHTTSLFKDLTEFMSNFNSRNLVQSKDLEALVSKANAILGAVKGDKPQDKASILKDSDEARNAVRAQFTALTKEITDDIKPKLGRAFNFDLD